MVAFCQRGMSHLWPCTLELTALRATRVTSNAIIDLCQPFVATDWAVPLLLEMAGSCEVMWCAFIGCAVPAGSHIRGSSGHRVMLTHFPASAEWAAIILCSACHLSLPLMGVTIWTVRACPVHLPMAVWGDEYVAQVSICGMVPLLLQLWAKQADVWTLLLFGVLTDNWRLLGSCAPNQQTTGLVDCSMSQIELESQWLKQDVASVKLVSFKQLLPRMQGQQHHPCGCCKAFLTIDASPGGGLCQARGECVARGGVQAVESICTLARCMA